MPILDLAKLYSESLSLTQMIAACDVIPLGDRPTGSSYPAFAICKDGELRYLLAFREALTEREEQSFALQLPAGKRLRCLATNGDACAEASDEGICVRFGKERSYGFFAVEDAR